MTHTLKSLLVTTVLALPAAFGAELDPRSENREGGESATAVEVRQVTQGEIEILQLLNIVPNGLRAYEQHIFQVVGQWYRRDSQKQGVTLLDVAMLSLLGHPDYQNGSDFNQAVATERRVFQILLNPSATVSVQDIIRAAAFIQNLGSADRAAAAAKLYEMAADHPGASAGEILEAVFWMKRLGFGDKARVAAWYERVANDKNASSKEILDAAAGMARLGDACVARAVALYERVANQERASAGEIIYAAAGMARLGDAYADRAAALYERVANQERASAGEIIYAAAGMARLGDAYVARAVALYERVANDKYASSWSIIRAADSVAKLGDAYVARAVTWYKRAANDKNASAEDILEVAAGVAKLGSKYVARAAAL